MASTNEEQDSTSVEKKKMGEKFMNEARNCGFVKKSYRIKCKKEEGKPSDICISKFGGYIPCFECDADITCPSCNVGLEVLAQIYVPSLPNPVKALFPSSLQNALIVLFMCTQCLEPYYGELESRIYYPEDFDKLVYKPPPSDIMIEQAIFESFPESDLPIHPSDNALEHPSKYLSVNEELDDMFDDMYDSISSYYCQPQMSYFGGHPEYIQADDNPGPDYSLILSLSDDKDNFSMMWGDAGTAQIWLRNDDSNHFLITWACG